MKRGAIHGGGAGACTAIGAMGALVFLFAFPKGSITTLMHEVLNLPGPGAGIAMIFGPFLILVVLSSSILFPGFGAAIITTLAFSVVYGLTVWMFDMPTNPKGAFGSALFMIAVTLLGLSAEVVNFLGGGIKDVWRCILAGPVANVVLCVFYWVAIFPRTARWVELGDLPVLVGVCLVGGVVSGCVAFGLTRGLCRTRTIEQKE